MGTTNLSRACSLATFAAILMGSTIWSGAAQAQNAATTTTTTGAAATNTTTPSTAQAGSSATFSRGPVDPGVRGGAPGAGDALPGLSDVERQYFQVSKEVFQ